MASLSKSNSDYKHNLKRNGMELTKKYRIVYYGTQMMFPLEPFDNGVTYVQKGMQGIEFNTLDEAISFINENSLIYAEEN